MQMKNFFLIVLLNIICLSVSSQSSWTTQVYNPAVVGIENKTAVYMQVECFTIR